MKKYINRLSIVFVLAFALVFSGSALAIDCTTCSSSSNLSTQEAIECGSSCASGNDQTPAQANTKLNDTIANVVNILSAVAGVAAVIMIVIGGFRYITSGGKQESVTAAKNTILYAIIGLVIVALAQILVHFVLNRA